MNIAELLAEECDCLRNPARAARGLVRRAAKVRQIGSVSGEWLVAADLDGAPLLLESPDPETENSLVAIRYAQEGGSGTPGCTPYELLVHGRLQPMREEPALGRYISRFCWRHGHAPESLPASGLSLYRVGVEVVELMPAAGNPIRLDAAAYLLPAVESADLLVMEWDNLAHQNYQHLDINEQLVCGLLGKSEGCWVLTGLDPEGMDFRLGDDYCRLPFAARADSYADMGSQIKALVRAARERLGIVKPD